MDIVKENQVLENADNNGNEDEAKPNNQEIEEDQPVNTNEQQENADERNENVDTTDKEETHDKIIEESGNENEEEPVPSPPPDLVKVSEEIDEFIAALGNCSKGDDSSPPDVPVAVEQFTVLVEALMAEYDSSDVPVKWDQLTDEDAATLSGAVDRMAKLLKALNECSSDIKYASSINIVGGILQRVMAYLEEEFRSFLEDHKVFEASQYSNDESKSKQSEGEDPEADAGNVDDKSNDFRGYTEETITDLYKLVQLLFCGGHETECCQIYYIARRNDLEEKLQDHGFEKHSIDDVLKMNWESLEKDIVSWNETMKQFTTIHFINEHKLSATVFKDHPSLAQNLFSNLARGILIQLLNFSEAIAMTKRAAEKLFKYLDVYESLRDLQSKIGDLSASESLTDLIPEASLTRGRLGEAMICIFIELENSISSDSARNPVPGGAVHPLTRYTMNYLEYACEYKDTLEQVFKEHQTAEGSDYDGNNSKPSQDQLHNSSNNNNSTMKKQQSPFGLQIVNILDLLHDNISSKSQLYKEEPLKLIFLMNNGRYILQKIKACGPVNSLLDDTWCRKKSSKLREYHKGYQRETWNNLLNVLIKHDGLIVHGKVLKPVLKERFKSFNAMFDEIYRTQSTWVIADEQLQSELRVSISNMVVPAYRSFMGRFSQTFTPGRQTEKYVKFQPDDVETKIYALFEGNPQPPVGRWRM